MTDRVIRYSSIGTYLSSPRYYTMRYILNLHRKPAEDVVRVGGAADRGTLGHALLNRYYTAQERTIDDVISETLAELELPGDDPIVGEAVSAVERYCRWARENAIDDGLEAVSAEQRVYVDLGDMHGDNVRFTFQPDIVFQDRFGVRRVVDFKFTAATNFRTNTIARNTQGIYYMWGLNKTLDTSVASFELRQVKTKVAKQPRTSSPPVIQDIQWYNRGVAERYERQLRSVVSDMVLLHQAVEAGDMSRCYVTDHSDIYDCNMADICCDSLLKSDGEVADIIKREYEVMEPKL